MAYDGKQARVLHILQLVGLYGVAIGADDCYDYD
jgi:hypothetical protein